MTWRVKFSGRCDADIREAGKDAAESVCAAVLTFAKTGVGVVEQDDPRADGPSMARRIRGEGGYALTYFDERSEIIYVLRIIAYNPPPRVVPLLDEPAPDDPSED